MALATYEPAKVTLLISGYRITGIENVTVAYDDKSFKIIKGIRGVNTRVGTKDSSATISVTVLQTSITNDILSEIVRQDRLKGSGRLVVSFRDASGSTEISSLTGYVDGFPSVGYGADAGSVTWTIQMLSTDTFRIGGNNESVVSLF